MLSGACACRRTTEANPSPTPAAVFMRSRLFIDFVMASPWCPADHCNVSAYVKRHASLPPGSEMTYSGSATSRCHQQPAALRKLYGEAANTTGRPVHLLAWDHPALLRMKD